jgi:hypothetical protein
MPGSTTTPGHLGARDCALRRFAFRYTDSVGTRNQFSIVAQWLACTYPCRRFADIVADACARLRADVVRYSLMAVDLHHLLLAGLPAHPCKNAKGRAACFSAHVRTVGSLLRRVLVLLFVGRFDRTLRRRGRDVGDIGARLVLRNCRHRSLLFLVCVRAA